jgi:hypothetical protein
LEGGWGNKVRMLGVTPSVNIIMKLVDSVENCSSDMKALLTKYISYNDDLVRIIGEQGLNDISVAASAYVRDLQEIEKLNVATDKVTSEIINKMAATDVKKLDTSNNRAFHLKGGCIRVWQ